MNNNNLNQNILNNSLPDHNYINSLNLEDSSINNNNSDSNLVIKNTRKLVTQDLISSVKTNLNNNLPIKLIKEITGLGESTIYKIKSSLDQNIIININKRGKKIKFLIVE